MSKMLKPKVILTIGISNSGKTTWANEFCNANPNFKNINRDDLRIAAFCGGIPEKYHTYKFSKEKEQLVTDLAVSQANWALKVGQGVVISDTNLNKKTRDFWKDWADEAGYEYEEKFFSEYLHVCQARNLKRVITLPDRVLRQQYSTYRALQGKKAYVPNICKDDAVIFDIDGTVAEKGDRSPFDMSKVDEDTPIDAVCDMARMYHAAGKSVIFFTGRWEHAREKTDKWLEDNGLDYVMLKMRPDGDNRPDVVVKEEMFWQYAARKFNVQMVVDDRRQVVDMWRELGIPTMQCDYGEF